MGSRRSYHSNIKVFIFLGDFYYELLYSKITENKMVFSFLGSFATHFQIKLSIHGSNCNSRFVTMSDLELFLLTGVLTPNFNTMDLVKILEKNKKLDIQIVVVTLKVTSCRTMSKKKR
jgi:hypothetical protein